MAHMQPYLIIFPQKVAFKIINFHSRNTSRSKTQTSPFQTFLLSLYTFFFPQFFLLLLFSPFLQLLFFFLFNGETRVRGLRRKKTETGEERSPCQGAASAPANVILASSGEASSSRGEARGCGRWFERAAEIRRHVRCNARACVPIR